MERTLLVDAAKYSMLALPKDLSDAELVSLWNTMPDQPRCRTDHDIRERSRLRRFIALMTKVVLSCMLLLLPVLAMAGDGAVRLERRFELTQGLTNVIVSLLSRLENLNPWAVLQATKQSHTLGWTIDVGHWMVNGVVGGALDGWHDAVDRRSASASRRASMRS
jgi:hypothetical protein